MLGPTAWSQQCNAGGKCYLCPVLHQIWAGQEAFLGGGEEQRGHRYQILTSVLGLAGGSLRPMIILRNDFPKLLRTISHCATASG